MITTKEDINKQALTEEMKQITNRIGLKDALEALRFPKFFQFETTRLCNSRCLFCMIDKWDKSHPFISDELFDKIAAEMGNHSDWIEVVMIQRAGEPLMDKKIALRIRRLKEEGIKRVNISTNASLLTEARARELFSAGLDEIMLSIDTVDKKNYEKIRVGLKYDTVVNNIKNFFRLREELKPDMIVRVRGVSFYDMKKSEQRKELARWEGFWNTLKKPQDRIYMKRAHNWGNQKKWEGYIAENDLVYHPCVLLWSTMHITTTGKVALCPCDVDGTFNMGDIVEHSIEKIWRNEKWARVRDLHASGNRNQIKFCRGCRMFDLDFSLENWQQKKLYEN